MGEFGKQLFALIAFLMGAGVGGYVGYLTYNNHIAIVQYYNLGGSMLYAGVIGFAVFVAVGGVLYKTMHPH